MHRTATLILLGASWAVLAGCEQSDTIPSEPAQGLPSNEAPRTDPDVQIGRSDRVDPGEPAEPPPAAPGQGPGGGADAGGADAGGGQAEVPPAN